MEKIGKKLGSFFLKHWPFLLVGFLFLALVYPVIHTPYHHDEYKWAIIADYSMGHAGEIPHPPLSEFLYHLFGYVSGYKNLRILPAIFSVGILFLLYAVIKKMHGENTALFSLFLYILTPYALLATTQIDIDGAFLPFWFLLCLYGYLRFEERNYRDRLGVLIMVLACVGGFASKLSFIIVPVTLGIYFLYKTWNSYGRKKMTEFFLQKRYYFLALGILFGAAFWSLAHLLSIPFLVYVKNFVHIFNRDYFQLLFLTLKALLYLGPLLVFAVLMSSGEWKKNALWYFFIINAVLFYGVIFDFSHRTLDRYWMILIVPFVAITSYFLNSFFSRISRKDFLYRYGFCTLFFLIIALCILSIPHSILPLTPKADFLKSFFYFRWNTLIPLTGGSGPLGFYTSLLTSIFFFGVTFFTSVLFVFKKQDIKQYLMCVFIGTSFVYNILLISEFTYGTFFGSPRKVEQSLLEYIVKNDSINAVITYNDIGAYELTYAGKYANRFYIHDSFIEANKKKLLGFSGHYLILNFPEINNNSIYWKYLRTCNKEFEASEKKIWGAVYNCLGADKKLLQQ